MSTGLKIIQSALSKIGAHSVVKQANPESIENGRNKINSYIARLRDDNIEFGAVFLTAAGNELSEPAGLTNVIEDNLAILLQPDHPGTQISPQLKINANIGYNYMVSKYQTICIPRSVKRSTMPLGAGNKGYNYHPTFFHETVEAPEICGASVLSIGEVEDYTESFTDYLIGAEIIQSFTVSTSTGITVVSASEIGGVVSYRIKANTAGIYEVAIKIQTSTGRIIDRIIDFQVIDEVEAGGAGITGTGGNVFHPFLAVIEPLDLIQANTVNLSHDFQVDWGGGNFVSYAAGNASSIATGTITVRSINNVTQVKFITNTFTNIDIQESNTLTSADNMCVNLSSLLTFNIDSTSNITTYTNAWNSCTGLTSFPAIDASSALTLAATWSVCSGLTAFPLIDTSLVTDFALTWNGCSGLASFPLIDTSSGTNFPSTFKDCTSLVCLSSLNTTSATSVTGLFTNAPLLVAPTAGEQTSLTTVPPGLNYVNAGACP